MNRILEGKEMWCLARFIKLWFFWVDSIWFYNTELWAASSVSLYPYSFSNHNVLSCFGHTSKLVISIWYCYIKSGWIFPSCWLQSYLCSIHLNCHGAHCFLFLVLNYWATSTSHDTDCCCQQQYPHLSSPWYLHVEMCANCTTVWCETQVSAKKVRH